MPPFDDNTTDNPIMLVVWIPPSYSFRQIQPEEPTTARLSLVRTSSYPPPADEETIENGGEFELLLKQEQEWPKAFSATSVDVMFATRIDASDACEGRCVCNVTRVQC